ncbi:hypothetical protein IEQ34_004745 [Dendrobium chrysotoxum]|uniref:Uncharacterized protein n=1 Tax=Dendrobium chrysotoxum TaxID=161865 RepID=A0AAV7HHW7_DENCH|nr:hypothetical protein IEQ34_004745 [Dendrobium chrysotoxum]
MASRFYFFFLLLLVLLFANYRLAAAPAGGDACGNGPGPDGDHRAPPNCLRCEDIPKTIQCNS